MRMFVAKHETPCAVCGLPIPAGAEAAGAYLTRSGWVVTHPGCWSPRGVVLAEVAKAAMALARLAAAAEGYGRERYPVPQLRPKVEAWARLVEQAAGTPGDLDEEACDRAVSRLREVAAEAAAWAARLGA